MRRVAYRLAIATAAGTVVLILAGGLVTNTGSALAVPDWPTTFGRNMFLFPWAGMIGGIFFEHSHRLIGAIVGALTLGLAAVLWPLGGRLRALGLTAVAAVVAQGVLGGLRVVLLADTLAIVHGCLAQAFFALVVAIVVLLAPRRPAVPVEPSLRVLAPAAAALVYVQIVLGALLTHAGYVALHLAGALVVFTVIPIVTARLRRTGDAALGRASRMMLVLLGVQLLLGIGSYLARFSALWIPGGQTTVLALPVAHRLVAALILATTVTVAVRLTQTTRGVVASRSMHDGPASAGVPAASNAGLARAISIRVGEAGRGRVVRLAPAVVKTAQRPSEVGS